MCRFAVTVSISLPLLGQIVWVAIGSSRNILTLAFLDHFVCGFFDSQQDPMFFARELCDVIPSRTCVRWWTIDAETCSEETIDATRFALQASGWLPVIPPTSWIYGTLCGLACILVLLARPVCSHVLVFVYFLHMSISWLKATAGLVSCCGQMGTMCECPWPRHVYICGVDAAPHSCSFLQFSIIHFA